MLNVKHPSAVRSPATTAGAAQLFTAKCIMRVASSRTYCGRTPRSQSSCSVLDTFLRWQVLFGRLGRATLALVDDEQCEKCDDGTQRRCDAHTGQGIILRIVVGSGFFWSHRGRGVWDTTTVQPVGPWGGHVELVVHRHPRGSLNQRRLALADEDTAKCAVS